MKVYAVVPDYGPHEGMAQPEAIYLNEDDAIKFAEEQQGYMCSWEILEYEVQ